MARKYLSKKELSPLAVVSSARQESRPKELKAWSDGQKLHTLEQASKIINQEFSCNYSVYQLRQRINTGLLGEAGDVWFNDGSYKINLHNFFEWRSRYPDERELKKQLRQRKN